MNDHINQKHSIKTKIEIDVWNIFNEFLYIKWSVTA